MLDREELLTNLEKDIKKIEWKVKHPHLYNFSVKSKKIIMGAGMVATFSLPFLVGATGAVYTTHALNMSITEDDMVPTYARVGTVTTSNGYFLEERVFGEKLEMGNSLKISTPWEKNDDNLYVRNETILDFTNLDLSNPDIFLSMDIKDLKSKVRILNQNTIIKENLDIKDQIYDEELIEVDYCYIDKTDERELSETETRKIASGVLYLFILVGLSSFIRNGAKFVFKRLPSDRIKEKRDRYVYITPEELEELHDIYMTKKQNIELLTSDIVDGPTLRMKK